MNNAERKANPQENTLEKLKNVDSAEVEFRNKALKKLIDTNSKEIQKLKNIIKSSGIKTHKKA